MNLGGALITRRNVVNGDWVVDGAGAVSTLMTPILDLCSVYDLDFTLPAGSRFYVNEVGIILRSRVNVTTNPTIRFGNTSNRALLLAATQIPAIGVTARQKWTALQQNQGQTNLSVGVTIAATGTGRVMTGRFYFEGMLLEDEVA